MRFYRGLFIGLALSLLFWGSALAGGKYFVWKQVDTRDTKTLSASKDGKTYLEEVSLQDKLTSKDTDEKAFILDNICTWISATGTDLEGKAITYQRRVTLREWIKLGKPKRVGGFSPYRVLLGHEPVMPDDRDINSYLETQDGMVEEPILTK